MSFFALENLVSSSTAPCVPWTFTCVVPEEVKGKAGKKERDKWINNPNTRHQCYSAVEGINPNLRIADPKGADEGNPPLKIHAFIADIDAPVSTDELAAGIARLGDFVPSYYEKTLSGNARLIWLFERPVFVPNARFAAEFLKLALHKSRVEQVAAALDKPAWESPTRYYTNSGEWLQINPDARVPYALLQGWVVETAEHHKWKKDRGTLEIPLPVVWVEMQKRFPNVANEWPGEFVEGAQGPSFWVQGSVSPKSAIVKPTGLFTFAAHAPKPFFSWADLLGKDWTDKYAAEQLGKAVEDIYHDGRVYYRKDGHGDWKAFSKEDIALHLTTDRGLSSVKDGGVPSEVNRAISYVQNWHGIAGAAPFVFQPPGIIVRNGTKFLNTHTRRPLLPANVPGVWGPEGNFPFLSKFLDGFLSPHSIPEKPLRYLLAWTARFYQGCYHLNLESGQNNYIMGPTGVGKTFWNQLILPCLVGGSAEAQAFLMGETTFNSQLFEHAYWTVDDSSVAMDQQHKRKWSAAGKRMAANQVFECHEKFRTPTSVEWTGRLGVTANSDEVSAAIVPDLSISNLDKINLFLAADTAAVVFPNRRDLLKIVKDELPFFARWLLDFQIPDDLIGSSRYGVKAYHEQSILRSAEQSSDTAGTSEIIEDWRQTWFGEHRSETSWTGSALHLLKSMHNDELLSQAALRNLNAQQLGQRMAALKAKGVPWLSSVGESEGRRWTIKRPDGLVLAPLPVGNTYSK
jgi:hypothetical protein